MIINYFRIALRALSKQKVYTAINVMGLSTGIASCLLIVMFVLNEFSYDRFHPDADRIFKVALERIYPGYTTNYAVIPHSYADVIIADIPEVESAIKMGGPYNNIVVSYRDERDEIKQFEENFLMAADSNFFSFFSINLLKGSPNKALSNLTDVVLTEETAKRYFGDTDPIGKTLRMFNQDFNVSAICENLPDNSHIKFDFLTRWDDELLGGGRSTNFIGFSSHVYLRLNKNASAPAVESQFPKLVDTYAAAQIESELGQSWQDYKKAGNGYRYFLQPLTSIHLDPTNIEAKIRPGGNLTYVYFLTSIAVLILIIACINFMNLATARSAERAREVGVRKTMGSLRRQLIFQFVTESTVLSLISAFAGAAIAASLLPAFNNLSGRSLAFEITPALVAAIVATGLLVGLLAGAYPAFALSSFSPISVLKGKFTTSHRGHWLRNGLVVFQFFISIVLIVGTLVVGKQMQYMKDKSLGYNRDHVVVVERVFALENNAAVFMDEVRRLPGVRNAGGSGALLGRTPDFFGTLFRPEGASEILTTKTMVVDDDLAATMGFEIVEGRYYRRETHDSLQVLLNETAVKMFGLTDPIGKKLSQSQATPEGNINVEYTIAGVVRDFNFQSLRDPVTPLAFINIETFGGNPTYGYVRVSEEQQSETLASIEGIWKKLAVNEPFKFRFLDQNLQQEYEAERKTGQIFAGFSMLAIAIACVGLFGLASYMTSLRIKEIGVRKILGATVFSLVVMIAKDFTRLIAIAFILAVPASWYLMDKWLQNFAFRVEIGILVFVIAGLSALIISWITISYQSLRAAIMNPVDSLRSD